MFQRGMRKFLRADFAIVASGFAAMMGMASTSSAALLGIGATVTPTAIALPAGDTIVPGATLTTSFVGLDSFSNVRFTGTLLSQVYSDPNTGGLDFLYQVTNNQTSSDDIANVNLSNFSVFTTDADYITGSGAVSPTSASRFGSVANPGKTVGFAFTSVQIAPGQNSTDLLVETNAENYMMGLGTVSDGGSGSSGADAPDVGMLMTNVPEPATFSAIVIAGGMLLGRRRR